MAALRAWPCPRPICRLIWTAAALGQRSNGAMRASGWNRIPLIRMTNVSLEPGDWTLDDMIAGTDDGIYMETNRSWSIDDRRLNFQFGCEAAWEIRGGKRAKMYRNPIYSGMTPQFWNSCDAVCAKPHWRVWGVPNCGKGVPGQTARVGQPGKKAAAAWPISPRPSTALPSVTIATEFPLIV